MFWGFITSCYLMSTTIVRRSLSFLWRRFCSSSSMNVVAQTFKRQGGLVINHNINNKPLQMTLTGWRCHVQCCCYRATNASTRVVVMPLRLFEKLKYEQNYDTEIDRMTYSEESEQLLHNPPESDCKTVPRMS